MTDARLLAGEAGDGAAAQVPMRRMVSVSAPTSPAGERAHRRTGSARAGAPTATPPAEQTDRPVAAPEPSGQGLGPDEEAAGLDEGLEASASVQPQPQPPQRARPREARMQDLACGDEAGGLTRSGSARALRGGAAADGAIAQQAATADAPHAPDPATRSDSHEEAAEPGSGSVGGASPQLRVELRPSSAALGPARSSSVGAKSPRLAPVKVPPAAASGQPGHHARTPRSARSAGASPASPSSRRTRSGTATPLQCCQNGACAALCSRPICRRSGGSVGWCWDVVRMH